MRVLFEFSLFRKESNCGIVKNILDLPAALKRGNFLADDLFIYGLFNNADSKCEYILLTL
jgi:hypothetical protein